MKYILAILLFTSLNLDAQTFNNRIIGDYAATEFFNIHLIEDTLVVIGFGIVDAPPYDAKINITKANINGEILSSVLYNLDSIGYEHFPAYQHASAYENGKILIQGAGGISSLNRNSFVGLYNENGTQIWLRDLPANENGLSKIASGSLLLENFHSYTLIDVNEEEDHYSLLVNHDADGGLLFQKEIIDQNLRVSAFDIILDSDSLLVAGIEVKNRLFKPLYPYRSGIMRMDREGNFIDSIHLSSLSREPQQIIETENKGYLILDRKFDPTPNGEWPKYASRVTKLSNTLEVEWDFVVGTPLFNTVLTNIKKLNDGNYIAVGNAPNLDPANPCSCGHIIKFNDMGQIIWDKLVYGDPIEDVNPNAFIENTFFDILELDDGGFIACGRAWGQLVSSYPQQAWLVRMNDQGEIVHTYDVEKLLPKNPLSIFPNPSSDYINLDVKDEQVEKAVIHSMNGAIVKQISDVDQVKVGHLGAGMYYVIVNDRYVKSFVVK